MCLKSHRAVNSTTTTLGTMNATEAIMNYICEESDPVEKSEASGQAVGVALDKARFVFVFVFIFIFINKFTV